MMVKNGKNMSVEDILQRCVKVELVFGVPRLDTSMGPYPAVLTRCPLPQLGVSDITPEKISKLQLPR